MTDKTAYQFGKTKIVPKSGQTTSYANYDDGYYQIGNVTSPRFVDNLDGTISDRATNLMWVKQPELIIPGAIGIHSTNQIQVARGTWATATVYALADLVFDDYIGDYYVCVVAHTSTGTHLIDEPSMWRLTIWTASADNLTTPSTMTWANGLANSEALVYAGYSDWRLPNISELGSIIDYSLSHPCVTTYFSGCKSSDYLSSTTLGSSTTQKWYINFWEGEKGFNANSTYIRPVRGGI